MKNKKLFAILTLLCFMFTLMPVAAFAGEATEPTPEQVALAEVSSVFTADENASEKAQSSGTNANLGIKFDFDGEVESTTVVYVWFVKDGSNVPAASVSSGYDKEGTEVLKQVKGGIAGVFTGNVTEGAKYEFAFANSGEYKVYASLVEPKKNGGTTAEAIADVECKLNTVAGHQSFEITSTSSSSEYGIAVSGITAIIKDYGDQPKVTYDEDGKTVLTNAWGQETDATKVFTSKYVGDGGKIEINSIDANNVSSDDITIKLVDKDGKAVKGETITLETNSANIELNKDKATTDQLGQIKFKVAGVKDGEYKIYVKAGSYEATIVVNVGGVGAATIKCVKSPSAPIDVTDNLGRKIQFTFTDANGNAVTAAKASERGAVQAFNNNNPGDEVEGQDISGHYVSIVSQPAASDLDDEDFYLVDDATDATDAVNEYRANLALAASADDLEEGTYEIKVVLDSGKYVYVSFEVKEFGTPVALNLAYEADAVEIGSYVTIDTLEWVDANGVTKDAAGKVDLAASGYAVDSFITENKDSCGVLGCNAEHSVGDVVVKDDDKYVGQTITVVAVDDRYNLTAEVKLTVADEATALEFDADTLAVDVNNKIDVSVVDGSGNKVALNRAKDADITYVILDKPEGAKVSATTDESENDILTEGTFVMKLTSNKVGNVTVQAVAKVTQEDGVVKYYTGTEIFAIGTSGTGDVVVMSIGSNQIVINGATATIDAAPIIENNRTFVPFRALAEAFGATVAYDEATQAVTAELNGTTVVMTIGSASYTVNGTEKTADVAPFINGSRTMVPVRFAAEAFGIKVIPTYDENGATADILFNL